MTTGELGKVTNQNRFCRGRFSVESNKADTLRAYTIFSASAQSAAHSLPIASNWTSLPAPTPDGSHQRKIHFNCSKIVSVVAEIVLLQQIVFCHGILEHFAADRFQLQQNRFCHTCGVPSREVVPLFCSRPPHNRLKFLH